MKTYYLTEPYFDYREMKLAHKKLGELLFGKSGHYKIFNPNW